MALYLTHIHILCSTTDLRNNIDTITTITITSSSPEYTPTCSNLYAQGTSPHVRAFNCIQRSHQHIFETFTTAALSGLVGSMVFPITTGISTLMYSIGRYYLSMGYAECEDGNPTNRYKYPLARFTWYGLLGNIMLGMGACAIVACGKKKF